MNIKTDEKYLAFIRHKENTQLDSGNVCQFKDLNGFDEIQVSVARTLDQSISETAMLLRCSTNTRFFLSRFFNVWIKACLVHY